MRLTPLDEALLSLRETPVTRNLRYRRNWQYYLNRPYEEPRENRQRGLYAKIRSVFNAVTKIVDVDARFTMGERLRVQGEPEVVEAVARMWAASDLEQEKYLLVRHGACCGDAFLKVLDNRPWERNPEADPEVPVKLLVLPPDMVDPIYDPLDRKRLVEARIEFLHGRRLYREVWREDEVVFYDPERPERVEASYPNRLGFIPVVHIRNLDIGELFGLSSFHHLLPTLDLLNEIASFLIQEVKIYGDPVIIGRNMEKGDLKKSTVDELGRPSATVWWTPPGEPGADFRLLEWEGGNIEHILAFVAQIKQAIEEYTPELVLSRVAQSAPSSGYQVDLQLSELVRKISEMRGNYFHSIEKANRMALRILADQGRGEFPRPEHRVLADPILPADEERRLRVLREEIGLGLKSRQTAMGEMGLADVAAERERVAEEAKSDPQ
jgi:hypothetical protein